MKILRPIRKREQGSAFLTSLMISAIMGMTLASYLVMTQAHNTAVSRSQTWNGAMVTSEAGVEDALALLNKYSGLLEQLTNWSKSDSIAQDNWSAIGGDTYYVRRSIGNCYYDVFVTNIPSGPIIRSDATVPWNYACNSPQAVFAASTVQTPQRTLMRKVQVQTKIDPLFSVAMAAVYQIDFNGKNILTDSFDSADPKHSVLGMYPLLFPAMQKANGDVVTDLAVINSLNVGNAKIKGQIKTGPNGTISIGPNGSVGDKAWVESGNKGIQTGHSANDMNVVFPPVSLPPANWLPAMKFNPGIVINGQVYAYVLGDGDWKISDLTEPVYVLGNARLHVTDKLQLTGVSDVIRIASNNASLKMYVGCATATVAGLGIVNLVGNAANFYYFGLPSNTSLNFQGNSTFTGCIYAPQADFQLGGGGINTFDFIGASVTKTVKMNGHYNFHYDENVRLNGIGRGYIATDWKEL